MVIMVDSVIPKLANIDVVEVLDLRGKFPSISNGLITSSRIVKVEGDLAQQIANLWRQLSPGQSARCHIPPFGLRFYSQNQVVLQASMCWECDNMYIYKQGTRSLYGLNLDQPPAHQLLALLNQVMD